MSVVGCSCNKFWQIAEACENSTMCDVDETQSHPPSPMLLLITSDGLLLCYYMMLFLPTAPSLNVAAEPLQGTERPSTCHVSNVSFYVLSGTFDSSRLLTG